MKKTLLHLAVSLTFLLTGVSLFAQGSSRDWASYNRTWAGDRFSPLGEITAANAGKLHQVCAVDIPDGRAFETGPIAIDGTIYLTTDTGTHAIDGSTCAIKWTHVHKYAPLSGLGGNRGIAYLDGRLFRGSGDGHAFAIDAVSGATVWDVPLATNPGESTPMAPIAWNHTVFIGNAGGDNFGVTGHVFALDSADGHVLWKFDTVPNTPEVMATWPKASAENPPTGGAFWTTFSLDAEKGILYVPSGNPAPDFRIDMRPGTNLYTNSLIALDARTGKMLGYTQTSKDDFHDWDASSAPAIVTTKARNRYALIAGKDGYLRGIDLSAIDMAGGAGASKGGIRYAAATTTHFNTKERLSAKKWTRFCPGSQGGSEWNAAAYDPQSNLAFVPAVDYCTSVKLQAEPMQGKPGAPWSGAEAPAFFGRQDSKSLWKGWLTAIDADTGRTVWKFRSPTPLLAGATPTAGGVIYTADLAGTVYAFNARTGKRLWQGDAGQPVAGGVISYESGGHQRIAVAAGLVSPIWPVQSTTARLVVFGLP